MAFRKSGCTILFCSHSPYHIRHLCDAALWLRGGQVAQFGPTEPVLAAYDLHTRERQEREQQSLEAPVAALQVSAGEGAGHQEVQP
ncbi:hypothetical protein Q6294_31860, partial [Klebsiella pneumoniae]|nr:hypothetical protein [Klebsiella pneumoniae]